MRSIKHIRIHPEILAMFRKEGIHPLWFCAAACCLMSIGVSSIPFVGYPLTILAAAFGYINIMFELNPSTETSTTQTDQV
jgi:hypothetical protein